MVSVIKSCLDQFQMLSGLIPNQDKSCMFICGIESGNKESLLDVFGYNESKLPIKYLGVPLITTKLTSSDCVLLVDRIIERLGVGCITLFLIRVDFSLSSPSFSLFKCIGRLYSTFLRTLF